MSLQNKLVVIVGGAGSLGQHLAAFFGSRGCRLLLIDKNKDKLKQVAASLTSYSVRYFPIDVTKRNYIEHLAQEITNSGRQPDILINAIGLKIMTKYEEADNSEWKQLAEAVLKGSRNAIKYLMGNAEESLVINIMPFPESVSNSTATLYASLKSGLGSLTSIWARELAADKCRVNAIQPGFMVENLPAVKNRQESLIRKIPTGKAGSFSNVADLVLFLASPQGEYINGAVIPVDGGYFC